MRLLAQLAAKSGAIDPRLIEQWDDIVGEKLARICRPVRLKRHGKAQSLEVAVANGPSAMAVQYEQQKLMQAVNRWMGSQGVTRIIIRQTGAAALKSSARGPAGPNDMMQRRKKPQLQPIAKTGNALKDALNQLKNNIKARND